MGQFITREKNQISDDMFDLMRDAGYDHVTTGIESGSEKLRKEMNKNFSNDAIELMNISMLTNAFSPKKNISRKEFLEFKSNWLIKKSMGT